MRRLLLSVVLLCSWAFAEAQSIEASVTADTLAMRIGEQIRLRVALKHDKAFDWSPVIIPDTLGAFEVIGRNAWSRHNSGRDIIHRQSLLITCFDSGRQEIPALSFSFQQGASMQTARSQPIAIHVRGVAVDTLALKPIKAPLPAPLRFREVAPYLVMAAIIGLGIWGIIWYRRYLRRRRLRPVYVPPAPPIPAHIWALAQLDDLQSRGLLERDEYKAFYAWLSDIFRGYIERRYGLQAFEWSSSELLAALPVLLPTPELNETAKELLFQADLVKFAKRLPTNDEGLEDIARLRMFVEKTRKPEAEPEAGAALQTAP